MADFLINVTSSDDGVVTVEFGRGKHNYFTADLVRALAGTLRDLSLAGARAAVLCSGGRNFCAGADFTTSPDGVTDLTGLYEAAVGLVEQPLPIVAAVQGAAVGGGMGLALAADFRVADPTTRFIPNFGRIGLHHGFGLTATLPAAVGHQKALRYLSLGTAIDGGQAVADNLCDRLAPEGELRPAAHALAAELASSAPLALQAIRRTMRRSCVEEMRAAVAAEQREQEILFRTADFSEGVRAARERRQPKFVGR